MAGVDFFFFWVITLSWVDSSGQSFYRVGFALASSLEFLSFYFAPGVFSIIRARGTESE